mmetsp:Transcript_23496/g.34482  ORF Transcript_23496/g.34482 Transcript_23496/m.34482 type:complete len:453 (+) Transcript_23496:85-1443(+)
MAPFQIQHKLTERKGTLRKKGKILGGMMRRWYHLQWDNTAEVGMLLSFNNDKMIGTPKKMVNLKECVVKLDSTKDIKDAAAPGFAISVVDRGSSQRHYVFWADTEMESQEWVANLRKHSVNSSIENGYEINREAKDSKLGSGSYSTVWKGKDRGNNTFWAIKEMQKQTLKKDEIDNLRDEVRISQLVGSHDNIVYMKEFAENSQRYYIVLEFLTGGELFDRIVEAPGQHFTEKTAADVMRQLMHALSYLHGKKIVHRDLKPENFLLADKGEDSKIKIADFGFACNVEGEHSLHGLCGSPGYVAPEIIKEKDGYGLGVDMWSMGVILYILLTGIPPFTGDSDEESFALTLRGHYDASNIADISDHGKDLVKKLLTYNPSKRITASGALDHPWLDGGAEDKVLRVQENLRSWRARMRFKKAIIATVATTRLHAIMRRAAARPDAKPVEEKPAED